VEPSQEYVGGGGGLGREVPNNKSRDAPGGQKRIESDLCFHGESCFVPYEISSKATEAGYYGDGVTACGCGATVTMPSPGARDPPAPRTASAPTRPASSPVGPGAPREPRPDRRRMPPPPLSLEPSRLVPAPLLRLGLGGRGRHAGELLEGRDDPFHHRCLRRRGPFSAAHFSLVSSSSFIRHRASRPTMHNDPTILHHHTYM
jgi:hypothetical protein